MSNHMEKTMDTSETTAVAIPARAELAVLFRKEGGLDPIISRIEDEVRAHVPDVSTKRGRDAIASLAYKVARSKTMLDDAGKTLNEEARKQIDAVDAARRALRARLDALKDEARKPLDEWEAREKDRVDALSARLDRLANAQPAEDTSGAIAALIARVEAATIDETWQEFLPKAAVAKDATLNRLRTAYAQAKTREDQEAEIARLRAETEAREAAERARMEAEEAERQRAEAARIEAERAARIEREKQEAAERARAEAEAQAKAEAERIQREAAERAEAARRAAEAREAELQREVAEAKRREEEAAQRERDRIAAEKRAEDVARAKREADAQHRALIRKAIVNALSAMRGAATPEAIADALMEGKIPHVKVVL